MRCELWPIGLWLGCWGILYAWYLLLDIYRLRRIIHNQRRTYDRRESAHDQQQHKYDTFRNYTSRRLAQMGRKTPE